MHTTKRKQKTVKPITKQLGSKMKKNFIILCFMISIPTSFFAQARGTLAGGAIGTVAGGGILGGATYGILNNQVKKNVKKEEDKLTCTAQGQSWKWGETRTLQSLGSNQTSTRLINTK
jgi:hypothetical protein